MIDDLVTDIEMQNKKMWRGTSVATGKTVIFYKDECQPIVGMSYEGKQVYGILYDKPAVEEDPVGIQRVLDFVDRSD